MCTRILLSLFYPLLGQSGEWLENSAIEDDDLSTSEPLISSEPPASSSVAAAETASAAQNNLPVLNIVTVDYLDIVEICRQMWGQSELIGVNRHKFSVCIVQIVEKPATTDADMLLVLRRECSGLKYIDSVVRLDVQITQFDYDKRNGTKHIQDNLDAILTLWRNRR